MRTSTSNEAVFRRIHVRKIALRRILPLRQIARPISEAELDPWFRYACGVGIDSGPGGATDGVPRDAEPQADMFGLSDAYDWAELDGVIEQYLDRGARPKRRLELLRANPLDSDSYDDDV